MKNGLFVTFEGIDGCGKTTAIINTHRFLYEHNKPVLKTREPGGTPLANKIRELLLSSDHTIDKDTEQYLFTAARCDHVKSIIIPNLENGVNILCDRFVDSTLAYQSTDIEDMWRKQEWFANADWMIWPDITFYLKVDIDVALSRIGSRNTEDRIEKTLHDRLNNMIDVYEELSTECADRFVVIDANQNMDSVAHQICTTILQKMETQ